MEGRASLSKSRRFAPDVKRAYAQAQLEASAKWIEQAPDDVLGHDERFRALVALDAPADDLRRAGDALLAADRRYEGEPRSFFLTVARAYLNRGVLLDRVPAILEEALKSFDDPEAIIEIDLSPNPAITARNRMMCVEWHAEAAALLSQLYEKQGQTEKAEEALRSLEDYLRAKAPPPDEQNRQVVETYRSAHYSYWMQLGALAEHQGRKLDALLAYREAAAVTPGSKDGILATDRRLWKELGGSDEAWNGWINAIGEPYQQPTSTEVRFTPVNVTLPEFWVKDVAGDT